jgi:hypothetical protein
MRAALGTDSDELETITENLVSVDVLELLVLRAGRQVFDIPHVTAMDASDVLVW